MNHTKEPWHAKIGQRGCRLAIEYSNGCFETFAAFDSADDLLRAATCVNALAGIPEPQAMAHALDLIRQAVWCLERQDRPATALVVADRLRSLWEQAKQASYQPLTTDPVTDQ